MKLTAYQENAVIINERTTTSDAGCDGVITFETKELRDKFIQFYTNVELAFSAIAYDLDCNPRRIAEDALKAMQRNLTKKTERAPEPHDRLR